MIAAAGVDIAAAVPVQGASTEPGAATGLSRSAGKAATLTQTAQTPTQSFRSSWESLMAAQGMAGDDGGENTAQAFGGTGQTRAAGTAEAASQTTQTAGAPVSNRPAISSPAVLLSDLQGTISSGTANAQAFRAEVVANAEEKNSPTTGATETTQETRTDHFRKNDKKESATEASSQAATMEVATTSLPAAALAPVILQPAHVAAQGESLSPSDAEQTKGSVPSVQLGNSKAGRSGLASAGVGRAADGVRSTALPAVSGFDRSGEAPSVAASVNMGDAESSSLESARQISKQVSGRSAGQVAQHTGQGADSSAVAATQSETVLPTAVAGNHFSNQVPAAAADGKVQGTETATASSSRRSAAQATPSSGRASELHAAASHAAQATAGQAGVSVPDQAKQDFSSLNPTRDLSGANAAIHSGSNGVSSNLSSASPASTDVRDTFAALDGESGSSAPTWVHAGARQAEAGYQDPALGWVGVRAQLDASGVHAALVPGSADAAQALGSHMAGLNAYLTEHHTPVETLTMAAPGNGWSGQGTDQGAGQNAGQGGYQGQQADADSSVLAGTAARLSGATATAGRSDEAPATFVSGGAYISVMA